MVRPNLAIISLFLAALARAAPTTLPVSKDASCGANAGFTCAGSSFGECCSQYGWCGSTAAYCGAGCQQGYGKCAGTSGGSSSSSVKPSSTTISTAKTTAMSSPSSSATPTATGTPTLNDCLGAKNLPVSWTTSPDYAQLAKPYNNRLPFKPVVIVLPTTVQHVQDAVACARQAKVKVQARSGGHSYAAFGLGGKDGSMVIDLQSFQSISLDAQTNVAAVGGGVRLGNLAKGIYDKGKRALAHGTCPGVGIGGHLTHGGYGYSSRAWGIALDAIVALDVVKADGTLVSKCSATNEPDLFYAMRGAGESFGIATTFYLATKPAPATVVNWSFSLPNMFANADAPTAALLRLQDFARNGSVVDRNLGFGVYMDGYGFSISGTYFGTLKKFNNVIKPELLRGLPAPSASSVKSVDWITSLTMLGGADTLTVPTSGYDQHDNFFAKSLTVPEATPFTQQGLNAYFKYIIEQNSKVAGAGGAWFSIVNLYGGADSQINAVPASATSYSDRSALWVMQHYGFVGAASTTPFPQAVTAFVQGLNAALVSAMPEAQFGGYANYVDPSLSAAQAHEEYYGGETYARLAAIKKVVDPDSVFWNPQAIGV